MDAKSFTSANNLKRFLISIVSFSLMIFSNCSSEKTITIPCDPGGYAQYVNSWVTKVNGVEWKKQSLFDFDILVDRNPGQLTTVLIENNVIRVSGDCIHQYTGLLHYNNTSLPLSFSVSISPSVLQNTVNDIQKLELIVFISPEIQDGKYNLLLYNEEKIVTLPSYVLNLVTKPGITSSPNIAFNPDPAASIHQALMKPFDFQSPLVVRHAAGPVNFQR